MARLENGSSDYPGSSGPGWRARYKAKYTEHVETASVENLALDNIGVRAIDPNDVSPSPPPAGPRVGSMAGFVVPGAVPVARKGSK